jgi:hypothetical protein
VRWSELPPERLEIELAKLGITVRDLVRDAHFVPELKPWFRKLSKETKQKVALEWFGDEGHPQPEERNVPVGVIAVTSPDWGRLPSLDDAGQPKARKPRHRHPDPILETTVKQLKWELAQRKAKPRDREFTQEKIAARLELDRTRVQQAEKLERAGWDLLRSHPEFSANDEFVRWPSAREAARLLASERAEN